MVTRSSRVHRWSPREVILVRTETTEEQLGEVLPRLRALGAAPRPLTRCPACNVEVVPLRREDAGGLVPPHVLRTAPSFARCPCCARVYWPATHTREILRRLARTGG